MRFSPGGCCQTECLCCKKDSKVGYLKLTIGGVGSPKCTECNSYSGAYISGDISLAPCGKIINNDLNWPSELYEVGDDCSACMVGFGFGFPCENYWEEVDGLPSGPHTVKCDKNYLAIVWNVTKQKRGFWFKSEWDDQGTSTDPWAATFLEGVKSESASEPYDCDSLTTDISLVVTGSILGCSGTITLKVKSQATP